MSKYVNSVVTTDQTGRLSNLVFGKNKFGYFLKIFKPPVNPKTTSQQNIRGFFGAATRAWAALTYAQRSAFNSIAGTIEYIKKGLTYTLTGYNLFVKLNRNLQAIGQPFYQDITRSGMVTPPDLSGSTVDVITTSGTEDIKLFIPATLDADTMAIVYASPVLKSSCKPNWKLLRIIMVIDSTFISGGSIKTQYLAEFGTLPGTGELVGFGIMPVNTTCGLSNNKIYMDAIGTI